MHFVFSIYTHYSHVFSIYYLNTINIFSTQLCKFYNVLHLCKLCDITHMFMCTPMFHMFRCSVIGGVSLFSLLFPWLLGLYGRSSNIMKDHFCTLGKWRKCSDRMSIVSKLSLQFHCYSLQLISTKFLSSILNDL